jgi:5-methylcytosine-specific restriction endonuclease McrA
MPATAYKRCPHCERDLPRTDFARDASKASGHKYICKPCDAARPRKRRHLQPGPALDRRPCDTCGENYQPHRRNQRYCSRGCHRRTPRPYDAAKQRVKTRRRALRITADRLAAWQPPAPYLALQPGPTIRMCNQCGGQITKHKSKYCSSTCAATAKLIYDRTNSKAKTIARRSFTSGYCHECGTGFVSPGNRCDRYCSLKCGKRSRRRRDKQARSARIKANGARDRISLPSIAKRDGWRCHICKRRVGRGTWSLDHLVPLIDGGSHTWDNVALAHNRCNSIRSNIGPAQLLLLG